MKTTRFFLPALLSWMAAALLFLPGTGTAMDAHDVMAAVDNRDKGTTSVSDARMILIDKHQNQRIREMKSIRKEYGEDAKGIIFFLSPSEVRNTAYMSHDWDQPAKEDDSWLYLPAMNRVKRIAPGDKSQAFMGSDFSYSDINGMDIEDWNYAFVKESFDLNGTETWVIKGQPKASAKAKVDQETGYAKILVWVQKQTLLVVKAKYWVTKGRKVKYFKAEEIQRIDGIWTPLKLTMVTTEKGRVTHSTILQMSNVQYDLPVKDSYFTPRSMEQGYR